MEKTVLEQDLTQVEGNSSTPMESYLNLKTFRGESIEKPISTSGGEADLFLLEGNRVLKLYRQGITPKTEVLEKISKLSQGKDNLVKILDFGFDKKTGRFFEIQEFCQYGSIKDIFAEEEPNEELLKEIIRQVNEALHTIHSEGFIHRDLKPSNILVKSKEPLRIVLSDFGISSLLESDLSVKMTNVKGTFMYSSPESFSGVMGQESDYWSLGMVILDILGKNPFKDLSSNMIMHTILAKKVPIDEEINENVQILLKGLLTQDRTKRWGYKQVKEWLEGKSPEIFYGENRNSFHYKFNKKTFSSLEELAEELLKTPSDLEYSKKFIGRGNLNEQLKKAELYDLDIEIDDIVKKYRIPKKKMVVEVAKKLNPNLPKVLFEVEINTENLINLLIKYSKKETDKTESKIIDFLNNGMLAEIVEIFDDKKTLSFINFYTALKEKGIKVGDIIKIWKNLSNEEKIIPFFLKDIHRITKDELEELSNPLSKNEFKKLKETFPNFSLNEEDIKKLSVKEYLLLLNIIRYFSNPEVVSKLNYIKKTINENKEKYILPENFYQFERSLNSKIDLDKLTSIFRMVKDIKEQNIAFLEKEKFEWTISTYKNLEEEGYFLPALEWDYINDPNSRRIENYKNFLEKEKELREFLYKELKEMGRL